MNQKSLWLVEALIIAIALLVIGTVVVPRTSLATSETSTRQATSVSH